MSFWETAAPELLSFLIGMLSGLALAFGKKWIDVWFDRVRLDITYEFRDNYWGDPVYDDEKNPIGYTDVQLGPYVHILNGSKANKAHITDLWMVVYKQKSIRKLKQVRLTFIKSEGEQPIGQGEPLELFVNSDEIVEQTRELNDKYELDAKFMVRDGISKRKFSSQRFSLDSEDFEYRDINI